MVEVLNSPYIKTPLVDSAFSPSVLQLCGIPYSQVVLKNISGLPADCAGLYAEMAALQLAQFDQHDKEVDILNEM